MPVATGSFFRSTSRKPVDDRFPDDEPLVTRTMEDTMRCCEIVAPYLCIETLAQSEGTRLRCTGEIDIANVDLLWRALLRCLVVGAPLVEVDLREVTFLDSRTIEAVLEAYHAFGLDNRRLLVWARPHAARLFHLLGAGRMLHPPLAAVRCTDDGEGSGSWTRACG
jgi:anti-anti-sigma factor